MKRANESQIVAYDEEIDDFLASCRSTVCSVVEAQVPMVRGAFAVDGSKHNSGSDETERRVHEERDPDAFLET